MEKHKETEKMILYDKIANLSEKNPYKDYGVNRMYEFSSSLRIKDCVIWGRGAGAIDIYRKLYREGAKVIAFIDSVSSDTDEDFCLKKVISLKSLKEINGSVNVIISTKNRKITREIVNKLNDEGIRNLFSPNPIYPEMNYNIDLMKDLVHKDTEIIEKVRNGLADRRSVEVFENLLKYRLTNNVEYIEKSFEKGEKQYYSSILEFSEEEVFVDAGGYTGDTIISFNEFIKGKYKKIFSFEPDEFLFNIIESTIKQKKLKNIKVYKKGLFNEKKEFLFWTGNETGSSKISEIGNEKIEAIKLDEAVLDGEKVTFLKMDIEGSEKEAIEGADYVISKNHPKLAISIYHKADDLWKIPYQIMEKHPEYSLYMRHYNEYEATETVLYGVIKYVK